MLNWIRKRRTIGLVLIVTCPTIIGVQLSSAATGGPLAVRTVSGTHTVIATRHRTRFVTVHVKGRVLRRYDHVLVVYVPRTVFHTHTTPRRRIVVPAHVVRIKQRQQPGPPFGETSLIVGVTPPPVTVDVPVTVTVPGPTQTVTQVVPTTFTSTETITDTSIVTVTITLPADPGSTGSTGGP